MVAEDNGPLRQGTVELLTEAGFRVDVAGDGAEALEVLAAFARAGGVPAVLVTDLDMPRVSGSELITLLRNDPRYAALAIIVLSGFEGASLPLGKVERMLAKPVESDTLLRAVADLCSRPLSGS